MEKLQVRLQYEKSEIVTEEAAQFLAKLHNNLKKEEKKFYV